VRQERQLLEEQAPLLVEVQVLKQLVEVQERIQGSQLELEPLPPEHLHFVRTHQ
jgi:hypothetical protein